MPYGPFLLGVGVVFNLLLQQIFFGFVDCEWLESLVFTKTAHRHSRFSLWTWYRKEFRSGNEFGPFNLGKI